MAVCWRIARQLAGGVAWGRAAGSTTDLPPLCRPSLSGPSSSADLPHKEGFPPSHINPSLKPHCLVASLTPPIWTTLAPTWTACFVNLVDMRYAALFPNGPFLPNSGCCWLTRLAFGLPNIFAPDLELTFCPMRPGSVASSFVCSPRFRPINEFLPTGIVHKPSFSQNLEGSLPVLVNALSLFWMLLGNYSDWRRYGLWKI